LREPRDSTPLLPVVAFLLVCFVVAGVLSNRDRKETGRAAAVAKDVAPISQRVEEIRGLKFREVPEPRVVTPEQASEDALRDLDEHYPPEEREADTELLAALGLIPPDTDLRELVGDISGEQVAGYYDTRRETLAVVDGSAAANDVLAEITLAHELDHALDDQVFELREDPGQGADDSASAYSALVEGTATAVMDDYAQRFISPGSALTAAFGALPEAEAATESIPPYIQRTLEFSYTGGAAFVQRLRSAAGGGWKLVDFALRDKPPVSTEQIIHPEKYLAFEAPVRVRIGGLGLDEGWERAAAGSLGELDTRELLRVGGDDVPADAAAAGWGGGRYELWKNADATVVVLRWAWDTPADAREFEPALRRYADERPDDVLPGEAIDAGARTTTLVLARTPDEAARLVERAASARG
jgi:hypothetical protein